MDMSTGLRQVVTAHHSQETENKEELGMFIKLKGPTTVTHFHSQALLPKGSVIFQNSITRWGASKHMSPWEKFHTHPQQSCWLQRDTYCHPLVNLSPDTDTMWALMEDTSWEV